MLAAASKEIGEANLRCVTFSGTGYSGPVGQTFENAPNIDWPRSEMANYTRTINWETGTSKETFDRKPGGNPASWKYGIGWVDGTPTQKKLRQTHIVNGQYAWHIDGNGTPVGRAAGARRDLSARHLADAARLPEGRAEAGREPQGGVALGAARKGTRRQRRRAGEGARRRHHVLGKYRVDATINSQNVITRIKTTVNEPALGDFNIEHESTNFIDAGTSKWPIAWHSHQGWDDNWQFASDTTGHNGYGGKFPMVQANVCDDPVPVPESVKQAPAPNYGAGRRGEDGQRRLPARRRTGEQLHGRVPRLRRRVRGTRSTKSEALA